MKKIIFIFLFSLSSCSYHFMAYKSDDFFKQNNIKKVFVPIAKNKTMEVGAGVIFSNNMRKAILQNFRTVDLVNSRSDADMIVYLTVNSIKVTPNGTIFGTESSEASGGLPNNRVLASSFRVEASVDVVFNALDGKILWQKRNIVRSKVISSGTYTDDRSIYNIFVKNKNKKLALHGIAEDTVSFAVDSVGVK